MQSTPPGGLAAQFGRTQHLAGFNRAGVEFTLATVHPYWGSTAIDQLAEVRLFAAWLRAWVDDWNPNLLVLGDFNLDRVGDPLYAAFQAAGLSHPSALDGVPRTLCDNDSTRHFYDQIAWFSASDGSPGWGAYVPWAIPGLAAGLAPGQEAITTSWLIVTGILGVAGTARRWRSPDAGL